MYIGEPHIVAAITPSSKHRANPKSAKKNVQTVYKINKIIITKSTGYQFLEWFD